MARSLLLLLAALVPAASAVYQLKVEGTYASKLYDEDAAEHIAFDKATKSILAVNKNSKKVDVISISTITSPKLTTSIDVDKLVPSTELQAVTVANGLIAVACVDKDEQKDGKVAFFDAKTYALVDTVDAGPHPEGIATSPDGKSVVVANEGVPNKDYTNNPMGSITVYDVSNPTKGNIKGVTYDFSDFAAKANELKSQTPPVHLYGPDAARPEKDLEPESIAYSRDGKTIYVSCQDNNAVAVFDVASKKFTAITGLGYVDMEMDASDKSKSISIQSKWPKSSGITVKGMRQPDGIDTFTVGGKNYVFTANEGDSRDEGFKCISGTNKDVEGEECRLKDVGTTNGNDADIIKDEELGRLKTTTCFPAALKNDKIDGQVYSYGSRSFSIFEHSGAGLTLTWDSGSEFEKKLEEVQAKHFNANGDEGKAKARSDDKGSEPEAVVVGKISSGEILAFVALERIGGIMVYDVSDPTKPQFQDYINNRNFCDTDLSDQVKSKNFTVDGPYDISPEGLAFIPKADSPADKDLLVVSNALSGSTTVYSISSSSSVRKDDGSICKAPQYPKSPSSAPKPESPSPKPPAESPAATAAAVLVVAAASLLVQFF